MAAKYLVTLPPGAPVDAVGFVKPGEIFTAPSADFVPSRTFRPVNEEARVALAKAFDHTREMLEARASELSDADEDKKPRKQIENQLKALARERDAALVLFTPPKAAPKIEPGVSLKELGELTTGGEEPTQVESDKSAKPSAPAPKGKRAADQ